MDRVVVPLPVRNRTAFVQLSGELDLATMDRARGRVLNTMAGRVPRRGGVCARHRAGQCLFMMP
jgi:hypothetical protein